MRTLLVAFLAACGAGVDPPPDGEPVAHVAQEGVLVAPVRPELPPVVVEEEAGVGRTTESTLGLGCGGGAHENTFLVDGIASEGITFGNGTWYVPCADSEPASISSRCGMENVYVVDGAPEAE